MRRCLLLIPDTSSDGSRFSGKCLQGGTFTRPTDLHWISRTARQRTWGRAMSRRTKAGGEPAKTKRRKTVAPKRNLPKARRPSTSGQENMIARLTRELAEAREAEQQVLHSSAQFAILVQNINARYGASSALAKQIKQGAPADVFASADLQWMDHCVRKKDTRVNLLGNKLVLIAAKDIKIDHVTIGPGFDLAKLAGGGRVATGDVREVPVGLYAKAVLERLGAWAAVEPKIAMSENVRVALGLVARGEAPLGIVYETDAKIEPAVKVIGVFPDNTQDPIIYPVALTETAKPDAAQYLSFLRSQTAKSVFEKYGFNFLVKL